MHQPVEPLMVPCPSSKPPGPAIILDIRHRSHLLALSHQDCPAFLTPGMRAVYQRQVALQADRMIVADVALILLQGQVHEAAPGLRSLSPLEAALFHCNMILFIINIFHITIIVILGHISLACTLSLFLFLGNNIGIWVRN